MSSFIGSSSIHSVDVYMRSHYPSHFDEEGVGISEQAPSPCKVHSHNQQDYNNCLSKLSCLHSKPTTVTNNNHTLCGSTTSPNSTNTTLVLILIFLMFTFVEIGMMYAWKWIHIFFVRYLGGVDTRPFDYLYFRSTLDDGGVSRSGSGRTLGTVGAGGDEEEMVENEVFNEFFAREMDENDVISTNSTNDAENTSHNQHEGNTDNTGENALLSRTIIEGRSTNTNANTNGQGQMSQQFEPTELPASATPSSPTGNNINDTTGWLRQRRSSRRRQSRIKSLRDEARMKLVEECLITRTFKLRQSIEVVAIPKDGVKIEKDHIGYDDEEEYTIIQDPTTSVNRTSSDNGIDLSIHQRGDCCPSGKNTTNPNIDEASCDGCKGGHRDGNNFSRMTRSQSQICCPICLSDFENGDEICQLKACTHEYHKSCITSWLYKHDTCPCCRQSVFQKASMPNKSLSLSSVMMMMLLPATLGARQIWRRRATQFTTMTEFDTNIIDEDGNDTGHGGGDSRNDSSDTHGYDNDSTSNDDGNENRNENDSDTSSTNSRIQDQPDTNSDQGGGVPFYPLLYVYENY